MLKNKSSIIAFFLFSIAGIFITFPLIFHLDDYVTAYGDELLIAWIHNWVIHAISTDPLSLFNANIFYPYQNTLAYSDAFFISSLFAWIPLLIFQEPITVVNFILITAFILLGFSVYLLSYYLTRHFLASLLSGMLVIFSPAVLGYYIHLQMLFIFCVPLSLLFFIHFMKTGKTKYFAVSLLFFLLQFYNSFLPAYFLIFSFVIICIYRFLSDKKMIKQFLKTRYIVLIGMTLLFLLPVIIPYLQVSKEFQYQRDIRDAVHLALQPEDMLYTNQFNRFYQQLNELPFNKVSQNDEFKAGFLGLIFTFLTIYALWYFIRNFKKIDYLFKAFFTIGIVGLLLSFGPVLHFGRQTVHEPFLVPLPYALFYYILPGFNGFRNSARWEMLFILAMAILIALIFHQLFRKLAFKKQLLMYLILFIAIIGEFNFPMQFQKMIQVKDFPKVYSWLSTTPNDAVIIEMPIYNWNMFPYGILELPRMYYSTIHFRKMVNGGSGFTPPPYEKMFYDLDAAFPSDATIVKLRNMGVTHIIIHKKEYDTLHKEKFYINDILVKDGQIVIDNLFESSRISFVKKIDDDYIFEIKK